MNRRDRLYRQVNVRLPAADLVTQRASGERIDWGEVTLPLALVSTQAVFCPKGMDTHSLGQANRAFARVAPPQEPHRNEVRFGQRPCTTLAFDEAFVDGRWPNPLVFVCGPWAMPKATDVYGRWPKLRTDRTSKRCVDTNATLEGDFLT